MIRLAIAIGGVAGAVARHSVGTAAIVLAGPVFFPWGTLAVNVAGSWMLGLLIQVLPGTAASPAIRAGLTVGFCAGFTTFSTFAYETVELARTGRPHLAAAYVAASLVLGVVAMLAGMAAGTRLYRLRRASAGPVAPADTGPSAAPARVPEDRP